jgi:hypothetical protein
MTDRCGVVGGMVLCGRELGHEGGHIPEDTWPDAPKDGTRDRAVTALEMAAAAVLSAHQQYLTASAAAKTASAAKAQADREVFSAEDKLVAARDALFKLARGDAEEQP